MFCDHILKYDIAADKVEKKFGKLEIGKAVKIGLQKLAAQEAANQPLGTDPFSDPWEGIAVMIDYNPDAERAQDYYSVGFYQPKIGAGKFKIFELNDEDLTNLLQFDSLYKQYRNTYRRRDFELALEGLRNFDSKFEYGLINEPEFVAIIEEIDEYYPHDETSESIPQDKDETAETVVVDQIEQDAFDVMTRTELKDWHRKNKTGFVVSMKTTDDELKESAREFENTVITVDTSQEPEKKEEVKSETTTGLSAAEKAKQKLAEMRKQKTVNNY